jgi:acetate kinase
VQVLVINSGSSSVKFELFGVDPELSLLRGEVERIGGHEATLWVEKTGNAEEGALGRYGLEHERRAVAARDHGEALDAVMRVLSEADPRAAGDIVVVGHRVVHGGDRFSEPVVIDDSVLDEIGRLTLLAPVHSISSPCTSATGRAPRLSKADAASTRRWG